MLMCRRMQVTSKSVVLLICAVMTLTGWCPVVRSTQAYSHVGCYYEVFTCATITTLYVANKQVNVSIFDTCLNLARTKGVKYFGVQAKNHADCMASPKFHELQNPNCLKLHYCNKDKSQVTDYSYDLYALIQQDVDKPPKILRSPSNQTSNEKATIEIRCEFEGNPFPTVIWRKNGHVLVTNQLSSRITSNVTKQQDKGISVLKISNLKREDQGFYICKAKNENNTTVSERGYLEITYKPKIFQPPSNQTRTERQSVTMKCYFEGKPFPMINWHKNNQILNVNSNSRLTTTVVRLEVYNGLAQLYISNLTRHDQGQYSCVVKNSIKSVLSKQAFLDVRYPPVIFSSPHNITRNESDKVRLACTMEGNPKPTVIWKRNGNVIDIKNDNRIKITTHGNASLWESSVTIVNLRNTDDGHYVCSARNDAARKGVQSTPRILVVNFLDNVFISSPNPHSLILGQKKVSLQCYGYGFPPPVLSWYKEGISVSQIKNASTVNTIISSNNVSSQLFLTTSEDEVTHEEAGNYTCEAYSNILEKTTRETVEVLFRPEITYKPADKIAVQGTQASFYCNATGIPEPVISWRFSGGSLPKHIRSGNKIVIKDLRNTKDYEGEYTCIARSRAGKTEEAGSLTVDVAPRIVDPLPSGIVLQLGETIRLTCNVYGDPEPSYQWTIRKPGTSVTEVMPDQNKFQLEIPDIRVKDAAYYGCTAENRVAVITLQDVLVDIDTSLVIINGGQNLSAIAESNVTVRCTASSEITPEVKMIRNGVELQTVRKISYDSKVVMGELTVYSVSTDDSGKYTCVAKNRQKSVEADVILIVDVPIKIDMDITLQDKKFSEDLSNKTSERYRTLAAEFVKEMTKLYINETGFERVEVLGFRNGSVAVRFRVIYKVKVQKPEDKPPPDAKVRIANVVVRKVKESDGIVGTLKIEPESIKPLVKPPSPRNLTATNIKKRELTIQWKHPLFHENYGVENYVIKYKVFGKSWKKVEKGKFVDTFILEDLEPDTKYSIKTHAVNYLGEGLPSNVVETQTLSAFWETFAKVFIPLLIIIIIIIIVVIVICLRRRRLRNKQRPAAKEEDRYTESLLKGKKLDTENDIIETIELAKRWKEIPRDHLVLNKELGSGQFGVVFKGFLREKGEDEEVPCAVKMLKPNPSDEAKRDLFNELEIMASVEEHPNIVNLFGACTGKDGPLYVIVEFATNGCLLDYLRENRMSFPVDDGRIEEISSLQNQEKIRLACDVAMGMQHLAKFRCVHRDLAARNVLLGKDRIAKVADFGLSRDVYEQGFYEKSSAGGRLPAKWMSIEALETLKATTESDVWSFGVLLWEIETGGKMPYAGLSYMDLLKALKSGVRLQKPALCTKETYSIMRDCWDANPYKRPTFGDLSLKLDNLFIYYLEE